MKNKENTEEQIIRYKKILKKSLDSNLTFNKITCLCLEIFQKYIIVENGFKVEKISLCKSFPVIDLTINGNKISILLMPFFDNHIVFGMNEMNIIDAGTYDSYISNTHKLNCNFESKIPIFCVIELFRKNDVTEPMELILYEGNFVYFKPPLFILEAPVFNFDGRQ